ncbi:MAG: hypothetical protein HZB29_02510 [Nitrospinae bacterium]|nr:hypothetical protein [Nitrospinota bacterium]
MDGRVTGQHSGYVENPGGGSNSTLVACLAESNGTITGTATLTGSTCVTSTEGAVTGSIGGWTTSSSGSQKADASLTFTFGDVTITASSYTYYSIDYLWGMLYWQGFYTSRYTFSGGACDGSHNSGGNLSK